MFKIGAVFVSSWCGLVIFTDWIVELDAKLNPFLQGAHWRWSYLLTTKHALTIAHLSNPHFWVPTHCGLFIVACGFAYLLDKDEPALVLPMCGMNRTAIFRF